MRISWGVKIAILYVGFVVMILSLVAATHFQKSELVTEDYYQQETHFQQRLDATAAANALPQRLRITPAADSLYLHLPSSFSGQDVSGKVRFYAPSRAAADRDFPLTTTTATWAISRSQLARVAYEVQVSWHTGSTEYYQTLPLNLNPS